MSDPRAGRWAWWVTLALVLPLTGIVCFTQAAKNDYDFHHFYRDASYVWRHGALNPDLDNPDLALRRQLPFYLPVVPLALAPLAAGGLMPAALLWTLGQLVAAFACVRMLWDVRGPEPPATGAFVVVWALSLPVVYESARFNQLGLIVLALVLGGMRCVVRRRPITGGGLLAIAAVLKLLPGLLLVWLLLKRQWRAAITFVLVGAAAAVLPCLIWFGPAATWNYHVQWFHHDVTGAPMRGMTDDDLRAHFIDHRNQSLSAVTARLVDPEHPFRAPLQPLQLGADAARWISRAGWLVLACGLIWVTRRPLARDDLGGCQPQLQFDASLYLLGLLLLSPLLRTYYLVWAIPAVHALAKTALWPTPLGGRATARAAIVIWIVGMLGWTSVTARTYGVHLWMLIAIAVLLVVVNRARDAGGQASGAAEKDAGVMAAEAE